MCFVDCRVILPYETGLRWWRLQMGDADEPDLATRNSRGTASDPLVHRNRTGGECISKNRRLPWFGKTLAGQTRTGRGYAPGAPKRPRDRETAKTSTHALAGDSSPAPAFCTAGIRAKFGQWAWGPITSSAIPPARGNVSQGRILRQSAASKSRVFAGHPGRWRGPRIASFRWGGIFDRPEQSRPIWVAVLAVNHGRSGRSCTKGESRRWPPETRVGSRAVRSPVPERASGVKDLLAGFSGSPVRFLVHAPRQGPEGPLLGGWGWGWVEESVLGFDCHGHAFRGCSRRSFLVRRHPHPSLRESACLERQSVRPAGT